MPVASPGPPVHVGVSHHLLLWFKNLLGRLEELRKTLYLHLLVYYKDRNSGTAKRKMHRARYGGGGAEFP